jgi:hypothetical protein
LKQATEKGIGHVRKEKKEQNGKLHDDNDADFDKMVLCARQQKLQ